MFERYGNKQAASDDEPQYMRLGHIGASLIYTDKKTGFVVLGLRGSDIDVSRDGITWFHFLGSSCINHLKAWSGAGYNTIK
jgi:hypothetical protein